MSETCEAETYLRALAFAGPDWTLKQCYDHIERFTIEAVVKTVTDPDANIQAQRADQARIFWQERFGQSADRVNELTEQLAAANADRARLVARVSDLEAELHEAREERNFTERDRDNWAEAANTAAAAAYRELLSRRAVLDWHHMNRPQNGCPPRCAQLFGPDRYDLKHPAPPPTTAHDGLTTTGEGA